MADETHAWQYTANKLSCFRKSDRHKLMAVINTTRAPQAGQYMPIPHFITWTTFYWKSLIALLKGGAMGESG